MTEKQFVDTNILVYAHNRSLGRKHEHARSLIRQLWENNQGALSTQVLQEFCVALRRNAIHAPPADELWQLIQDYCSWEIVVNDSAAVVRALELEQKYKISFWDALIVQAAENCGASVLYSEDLSAGQRYGSVEVVNPFEE
ncbi:MAG TPA: PIN domain-containing protein [Terriglobales bacterium]|nr:PIN domain-containing protein [Terriglobales bacterium]